MNISYIFFPANFYHVWCFGFPFCSDERSKDHAQVANNVKNRKYLLIRADLAN